MTMHLYFARRFLVPFLSILSIFGLLQILLDMIEQLRRFDDISFSDILQLTFLKLPEGLYELIPLVVALAAIAMFLSLARSSELVVARASGRSGVVLLLAPCLVAFCIGILALAMGNPIVAATSKRFDTLSDQLRNDDGSTLSIGSEGLWLRQGADGGQTVISARSADAEGTMLYDVSFLAYAPNGGPTTRILAQTAELMVGAWHLNEVKLWNLEEGINSEAEAELLDSYQLASPLTQDDIRDRFGKPSAVPIWELPDFIAGLENAGFTAQRYVVWLQVELARPMFLLAMVLVAAVFTMRPQRGGRTGLSVLAAVLLGFSLYYVRNFALVLGENGQIPAVLAAWVPPSAALMLGLGLVLQREDG